SGPYRQELGSEAVTQGFGAPSSEAPTAFTINPTRCGPLGDVDLLAQSWQQPGLPKSAASTLPAMGGCEALQFDPRLGVTSESHVAGEATGYEVDLEVPQEKTPTGPATPDVRDVTVTLPQGTVISPSVANGLAACSEAQFGLHSGIRGACPSQSKIGVVTITTPLLAAPLSGGVYLGQPECDPCAPLDAQDGKMVRLLLEVEGAGVVVKLAGHTEIDQQSGQLTTVFTEDPQLPFSDVTLSVFGGSRAPLVNPSGCGPVVATASLRPWSTLTATESSASMSTTEGCSAPGFAPSFAGGDDKTAQAGAFSGLVVTLSREAREQTIGSVSVGMPPGLLGMLKSVTQCPEAQANTASCSASSEIGSSTVTIGAGSQPYAITGGKVFLTGPYGGAPFGLSIVMPAHAGPFTLAGNTGTGAEVVRAAIAVDPHTGAVTITSAPLPAALDGVPLDIRQITVDVDREGFVFNPTNCNAQSVLGTITSAAGAASAVAYPFQAVNCATLGFKPGFKAFTSAKTSRNNGASLRVLLTYPKAAFGTQANIKSVHVELPKALPSRLSTLNHACLDSVFNQNPANCPSQSRVGVAKAITPILPVPLEGPAYFVSHGGQQFPELIVVLQGYGVTIDLAGETFISKNGVTSSTFASVPDVPVSSFELTLPEGQYSALAANGDLCVEKLAMPTTFTAHNGAKIEQRTPISVQGCKPQIRVLHHSVKGKRATIVVSVPSAGTLLAGGNGLSRVSKQARGAGVVTVTLRLSKADQRFVARHHGRRLMAPIHLSFRPSRGKRLEAQVAVLMK
ncbi:MAG: hypothetical protein FWD42_10940, partial [Solirubrobacterales bacterium]|nr:hypothetical protein [Solirubrobacterales bacterium]